MAYGFGAMNINAGNRRGFYVPGHGTFERNVHSYVNDLGEKVIQSAGVLRNNDGSLHAAYRGAPGTLVSRILEKQKKGFPLDAIEIQILNEFFASNPTAGLPSVDDLGGNHNGGIFTKVGTADKKTTSADNFSRATRSSGRGRTLFVGGGSKKGNGLR